MDVRLSAFAGLLAFVSAGCAGAAQDEARPRAAASPTPLTDTWISAPREPLAPPATRTRSITMGPQAAPYPSALRTLKQQGTILIGEPAPPPAPTRPAGRARIAVTFHHADLENAMRFLADSGRFNLVVESGLTGSVTASLRGVDAYDALLSIAEANGAAVRFEHGIVMVRKAAATR
jgi:hypothetical protein